jgi:NADH-quinone oxidoreductase subunit G
MARLSVFPPGDAREDWKIVRALAETLGKSLPYDSLSQIRRRLAEVSPTFLATDAVTPAVPAPFTAAGKIGDALFVMPIENYYMTDTISRASPTMAKCMEDFGVGEPRTGTHG